MHIEIDGGVWRIVEFQHVKPGKGGAFVRTKVKNLDTGAVVDRTFRAGEKFQRMHTEVKSAQYLYDSGDDVVFMEDETYEQFSLPRKSVAEELEFIPPSTSVQILTVDGKPVRPPAPVVDRALRRRDRAGREGRHGLERDEAGDARDWRSQSRCRSSSTSGDRIKVDPREGRYISVERRAELPSPRASARRHDDPAAQPGAAGRPHADSGPPAARRASRRRRLRVPRGLRRRCLRHRRAARRREPMGADPRAQGADEDAARHGASRPLPRRLATRRRRLRAPFRCERGGERDRRLPPRGPAERRLEPP